MSDESKKFALDVLRKEFVSFMQSIVQVPGAHIQKQQALLRFDEGHMWMQNAIVNYVDSTASQAANDNQEPAPTMPPVDAPITNDAVNE